MKIRFPRRAAIASGLAAAALGLAAAVAGAQPAGGAAQSAAPSLTIREPADGTALLGEVTITAALTPPVSGGVELVVTVDGRELCRLQRPPWSCSWDAGRDMREHHVRVVATLADGRRLVANRRTKGLDINELIDVAAVQVPVIVTDAKGRFVRGLKME